MPFCSKCGKEIPEDATYCPSCGLRLVTSPLPSLVKRPTSISVAAILFIIFGILELISGVIMLAVGELAYGVPVFGWFAGGFALVLGIVSLICGVLDIVTFDLLWKSKRSGGVLGIISAVIGILLSFAPYIPILSAIAILLNVIPVILIAIGWSALR